MVRGGGRGLTIGMPNGAGEPTEEDLLAKLEGIGMGGGLKVVFSAPEPKAQVHYCDHALSVVRRLSVCRR